MELKEILSSAEEAMKKAVDHGRIELSKIRTGRASTGMLDSIQVDYYGSPTPLSQVASVSTPDASTIMIQPWEKSMLGPIERAIMAANVGLTPNNDGSMIRLMVPPLTEERRRDIAKQARHIVEESKVGVRNARRDAMERLKRAEKEAHMSEDIRRGGEDDVQKLTDRYINDIDNLYMAKEKEILTV